MNFPLKQFAVLTIAALAVLPAPAATWYVDAARPNDTGDGTSWGTAKQKLESGVGLGNTNGGSVLVANGTYTPAAEVAVTNAVTVSSVNGAEFTFVNGAGAYRCFNLNHTNAVVDGFTLTNGLAADGGGALVSKGILRNCRLIRNTASSGLYAGGGAHVSGTSLSSMGVIEGCLVSNNMASSGAGWGGGLYIDAFGMALNCTNVNNGAYIGAGVVMVNGGVLSGGVVRANASNGVACTSQANKPLTLISDCLIADNIGPTNGSRSGGGMYIYGDACTALVVNCTINNNWARGGGGASVDFARTVFDNCRIVGNTAIYGGGILIAGAYALNVTFTNCLIASNVMTSAGFPPGGTPQGGGAALQRAACTTEFDHCVISNNVSADTYQGCAGIAADTGGPLYVRFSQIVGNRATNYTGSGGLRFGPLGGYASNCVIRGNSCSSGGNACGIVLPAGGLYNCLVVSNTGSGYSGIWVVNQGGTTVECCTVVGNGANGVYVPGTQAWIRNSIVISNGTKIADNFIFQYNGATGSVMGVAYSCSPTNVMTGNGNITQDPAFSDYAGGNFRLSNKSPCVNAGTNQLWMNAAVDLDGLPRIRQGRVDMGAYEWLQKGTVFEAQ